MMPLHLIEIDRNNLPEPPRRGTLMPLERALAIAMLDPNYSYYPIEIAQIAFIHEIQQGKFSDNHRAMLNMRRCFTQLAEKADLGTNVALKGSEWFGLVRSVHRPLAALMDELKERMEENPGVVFTYHKGRLIPYPDQSASTAPLLPPELIHIRSRRVLFSRPDQNAIGKERETKQVPTDAEGQVAAPESNAESNETSNPTTEASLGPVSKKMKTFKRSRATSALISRASWRLGANEQVSIRSVKRNWLVAALLMLLVLVPGATALYWYQLDEVNLKDITEMGVPMNEPAYFMATGTRYEEGDRLRFEGEVGVIKQIRRAYLVVGTHTYSAPALFFFGREMSIEGNMVVYPGNSRHIAGNFWISESSVLGRPAQGYLSWCGGYKNHGYARGDVCDLFAFWSQVTGKELVCNGSHRLVVPPDLQFEDLIEQCIAQGASIQQFDDYMEVTWP